MTYENWFKGYPPELTSSPEVFGKAAKEMHEKLQTEEFCRTFHDMLNNRTDYLSITQLVLEEKNWELDMSDFSVSVK